MGITFTERKTISSFFVPAVGWAEQATKRQQQKRENKCFMLMDLGEEESHLKCTPFQMVMSGVKEKYLLKKAQ
jgi:hypothetical protein